MKELILHVKSLSTRVCAVSASGHGDSEQGPDLRLLGVKDARVSAHVVKTKPLTLYSHDTLAGGARHPAG